MNITLFKELTTDDYLAELQAESDGYIGFYVEMEDAEQRKIVKDKASLISGLLKKLDRARIDKSKSYKIEVEAEAAHIKGLLETANLPFTDLIDGYNADRKIILDAEKVKKEAAVLIVQIEIDHASAIDMDKLMMFEIAELKKQRETEDAEVAERAAAHAVKMERIHAEGMAKRDDREKKAREADIEHKRNINVESASFLCDHGFSGDNAIKIIKLIAQGKVKNVTINY